HLRPRPGRAARRPRRRGARAHAPAALVHTRRAGAGRRGGGGMTTLLLTQLLVILVAARICGGILRHFGQPPVIGEMAAGLLLGPIAFGAVAPDLHAALFPAASLPSLSSLATIGLMLFMFTL